VPMNNERDRKGSAALRGRVQNPKPKMGGTIPSPQQMTPEEARQRSLMGRPEMAPMLPQDPTFGDIPNMSPEQLAPFNRPAPDLNDAVFGDVNPLEFLRRLFGGR